MIRNLMVGAMVIALAACGDGSPFPVEEEEEVVADDPVEEEEAEEDTAATDVEGVVTGFTFDPTSGTVTLSGLLRDGDETTTTFNRRAALDRGPYQAYTAQDDPLDQHATVYVRTVGDVSAAVGVTGGQFTYYSGGTDFERTGAYDPIVPDADNDQGQVTYAGQYVGLTNLNGPNTDLLPIADPTIDQTDNDIPSQAGPVTGRVLINVSFDDQSLSGAILDRRVSSNVFGEFNVANIILVDTTLQEDGTFSGEAELPSNRVDVGSYAGVIGGVDSEAMAGGVFLDEHFDQTLDDAGNPIIDPRTGAQAAISGEEEYGIFVLGRCGGPVEDPSAQCDIVDPE